MLCMGGGGEGGGESWVYVGYLSFTVIPNPFKLTIPFKLGSFVFHYKVVNTRLPMRITTYLVISISQLIRLAVL